MIQINLKLRGITLLLAFFSATSLLFGQFRNQDEPCGTQPRFSSDSPEMESINRQVADYIGQHLDLSSSKSEFKDAVTVPVIFFIVEPGPPTLVSIADVLDQLAVLNASYAPWNIQFCIAQNDPSGDPLQRESPSANVQAITQLAPAYPGVFWVESTLYGAINGIPTPSTPAYNTYIDDVTRINVQDKEYLFISVGNLGAGNHGISSSGAIPSLIDGVNVNFSAFSGLNCTTCYCGTRQGKTLVHEVGHYFGLDHTFVGWTCGNPAGGCSSGSGIGCPVGQMVICGGCNAQNCFYKGDYICDVPPQAATDGTFSCGPYPGPPAVCIASSLPAVEGNFMDYMSDDYMTNFTKGQADRMYAWMHLWTPLLIDRRHVEIVGCNNPVIYVDKDATGMANGTSWADAYPRLQDALAAAQPGDELWVADGVYLTVDLSSSPAETFLIPNGVRVFGGFRGSETSRADQNPVLNVTILDGGNISYHVVTSQGDQTTVLDGFTVRGGAAVGPGPQANVGGGIFLDDSDMEVYNCIIRNNKATDVGGGIYGLKSSSRITKCTFTANMGAVPALMFHFQGSAQVLDCIFNSKTGTTTAIVAMELKDGAYASIVNSVFCSNSATGAGALSVGNASVDLVNCTLTRNGGVAAITSRKNCVIKLKNTIIWDHAKDYHNYSGTSTIVVDYSSTQYTGWYSGSGNIVGNPLFSAACPAPSLSGSSPCINTGLSSAIMPLAVKDITGNPRVFNAATCVSYDNLAMSPATPSAVTDMGAYEYRGTCKRDLTPDEAMQQEKIVFALWPNPTSDELNLRLPDAGAYTIDVVDVQGRRLMALGGYAEGVLSLAIANLPSGVYILRVHQSGEMHSAKFVKQ